MLVLPISIAKIIVSLRIRFQAAFERTAADRDDAAAAAAEPPGRAGVQERHAADGQNIHILLLPPLRRLRRRSLSAIPLSSSSSPM